MKNTTRAKKNQSEKVINRISRIEGQLRGIRRMVEEKKECMDIITQISAIREAAAMLGLEILKDQLICKRKDGEISEKYLKTLLKIK